MDTRLMMLLSQAAAALADATEHAREIQTEEEAQDEFSFANVCVNVCEMVEMLLRKEAVRRMGRDALLDLAT